MGMDESRHRFLSRIVRRHQRRLRAFLYRFLTDPMEVDELLQDLFLRALAQSRRMAEMDEQEAGRYLYGIARNLLREHWRKLKKERSRKPLPEVERLILEIREREVEAAETVDRKDRLDALNDCLDRLSSGSRNLVNLRFFKGHSAVHIAKERGESPDAVRMALMRVRHKLKTCVQNRLQGVSES